MILWHQTMNSYKQLSTLVENEGLRLVNVVAVPRSMSTALGRALNESEGKSLFVNEPFNRNNQSLELASQHIINAALPVFEEDGAPVTVITKNMAAYLGADEFAGLSAIADSNVWAVRHPLIQIGSLITRMANDLAIENGADHIMQSAVGPYLPEVIQQLECSDISTNFSRTGWEHIGRYYESSGLDNSIVVDGTELSMGPSRVLGRAALFLGLDYTSRMMEGWGESYVNINTGTSRFDTEENAWTSLAAISSGIIPTTREPLELADLPAPLHDHIINVAIPTYETMMGKSEVFED